MLFHSIAQNPKEKSLQGDNGPKIILKFVQKNKHERAAMKVLIFVLYATTSKSSFLGFKHNSIV